MSAASSVQPNDDRAGSAAGPRGEVAALQALALTVDCGGEAMVGVLDLPPPASRGSDVAVVVVVGGPQVRVGSHRQFVLLARALAAAGIPALRFDYRGMGDSDGAARSFEAVADDIRAAVDEIERRGIASRVVLWGLCDGASAAMMYGAGDPRVAGIVAVNPWVRTEQGLAKVHLHHYYARRLFDGAAWRALATGRMPVAPALRALWQSATRAYAPPASEPAPTFLERMHAGMRDFPGRTLVALSGEDLTAREFVQWIEADEERRSIYRSTRYTVAELPAADHTFSSREWRDWLADRTCEWIAAITRRS